MSEDKKQMKQRKVSDEQAERKKMTHEYDHEFANEPLTEDEKLNNKKTAIEREEGRAIIHVPSHPYIFALYIFMQIPLKVLKI